MTWSAQTVSVLAVSVTHNAAFAINMTSRDLCVDAQQKLLTLVAGRAKVLIMKLLQKLIKRHFNVHSEPFDCIEFEEKETVVYFRHPHQGVREIVIGIRLDNETGDVTVIQSAGARTAVLFSYIEAYKRCQKFLDSLKLHY